EPPATIGPALINVVVISHQHGESRVWRRPILRKKSQDYRATRSFWALDRQPQVRENVPGGAHAVRGTLAVTLANGFPPHTSLACGTAIDTVRCEQVRYQFGLIVINQICEFCVQTLDFKAEQKLFFARH